MRRVAIGPANHAGQAEAWARALRDAGHEAESFAIRPRPRWPRRQGLGYPASTRLPYPRLTTALGRTRRAVHLAEGLSHLLLDGFVPVKGAHRYGLTRSELEWWQSRVPHVGLVAHGSDVRAPDAHALRVPDSYFLRMDPDLRATLQTWTDHNLELARTAGVPLFVSTPDLLLDLPGATWVPVSVQEALWRRPERPFTPRPRVLYAPSAALKGSDVVDPVLSRLHDKGAIEYVRVAGVPNHQMPNLVGEADLVVDQIRTGSYGVAAVEAMFSGALVVGYVSPEVRTLVPGTIPVHDAPAAQFEEQIAHVLDLRPQWPAMIERARGYARDLHDGRASSMRLERFLNGRRASGGPC